MYKASANATRAAPAGSLGGPGRLYLLGVSRNAAALPSPGTRADSKNGGVSAAKLACARRSRTAILAAPPSPAAAKQAASHSTVALLP